MIINLLKKIYEKKKILLFFIFIFSVLISIVYLLALGNLGPSGHQKPGPDYLSSYAPVAESIALGKGIPLPDQIREENKKIIAKGGTDLINEYASFRYPIGYPFILSRIFLLADWLEIERINLIIAFNIIISALSVCFLFLLTNLIFGKKIALISSILWATYPFNLWFIKNPNTEVPFILFLYIALWAYILALQKKSVIFILVSSIFFGFASLIRAISVFLPFVLAVFLFFALKDSFKKKFLLSLIMLVIYIIIVFPWGFYIYQNTGKFNFLSISGPTAISDGIILLKKKMNSGSFIIIPEEMSDLIDDFSKQKINDYLGVAKFFINEAVIRPWAVLGLGLVKITRSWYATSEMWWEKKIFLIQLLYVIPALFGAVLWFKKLKEKKNYFLLFLVVIFYFWAMTVIALSILRYMIPAMGLVIVFSSVFVSFIIKKQNIVEK